MFELDSYCENLLKKYDVKKYYTLKHSDIFGFANKYLNYDVMYVPLNNSICGYTDYIKGEIVLNSNIISDEILNFTLAHECAHIIIKNLLCDNKEPIIYESKIKLNEDIEASANYIGSSLLIPKSKFIYEYLLLFGPHKIETYMGHVIDKWDITRLNTLKSVFHCSYTAILIRAKNLGFTHSLNESQYKLKKAFSNYGI